MAANEGLVRRVPVEVASDSSEDDCAYFFESDPASASASDVDRQKSLLSNVQSDEEASKAGYANASAEVAAKALARATLTEFADGSGCRVRMCSICGVFRARYRCGRCRAPAFYCGRACQRSHWTAGHAEYCRQPQAVQRKREAATCRSAAVSTVAESVSQRHRSPSALCWADFDVFALVLAGLPVRAACLTMAVCPAWRRWGPRLLRVARWRGHPAARRLRSRPLGNLCWRGLYTAETCLLLDKFQDEGCRERWQLIGSGTFEACQPGCVSAPGEERPGTPMIAAALVHSLPGPRKPRRLKIRLRCTPNDPNGRCAAYVLAGGPEVTSCVEGRSPSAAVLAFFCWSPGRRRGRGRRVVGLLGGDSSPPVVDDTAAEDVAELNLRFCWQLPRVMSKAEARGGVCRPAVTLESGSFGRVYASAGFAHSDDTESSPSEDGAPPNGSSAAQEVAWHMVSSLVLGVGPGSTVQFQEVLLT